jgi:hypothetical protein
MKRLAWEASRLLEAGGWWLAPIVALLFAAAGYALAIAPALEQRAMAFNRHAMLEVQAARKPAMSEHKAVADGIELAALPSHRTLPKWLAAIFTTAKDLDVVLDVGDYRYIHNRGEPYGRYQVELPVYADYATVRRFTARLMNDMPFAVLEDIRLTRDEVDSDIVEAHLRLTLFLAER